MTLSVSTELDREHVDRLVRLAQTSREGVYGLLALLETLSWAARREVVAALAGLGDAALPWLRESLRTERTNETRIAATLDSLVASVGDVESALAGLAADTNPAVVADLANVLGRRRNPQSVPALIRLLGHADDNVAVAAIEALGRVGGRAAVDALVENVERDYFFRTYPAIDVLGRSGDPRAVAPLARLLRKPQYRIEAARALGRTADKSAVPALSELLTSTDDADVRVAALALAELIDLHRALYSNANAPGLVLRQHASADVISRIEHALLGADSAERVALCNVLGALQLEAAVPVLDRCLDREPSVAQAAAAALKQLGAAAELHLRPALVHGDSARRLILLPLMPRASSTGEVLLCLQDPDPAVRALACDTLARIGDASVAASLFAHLKETNPRVVQAAMRAIQSLGGAETEALALEEVVRSGQPTARRAALRVLAYYGYASAFEVFRDALRDPDTAARDIAIAGLAFVEHPSARALLVAAASDEAAPVRVAAMRGLGQSPAEHAVVAALSHALSDTQPWVRYYACQGLGKLGVRAAATMIASLLSDPAGQVRIAAIEALAQLKSPQATALLGAAASSEDPDMQRAALIGLGMMQDAQSTPVLIAASSAAEAATRLVALSALSAFPSSQTLPVVAGALRDADEGVRDTALELLASWPHADATRILIEAMRDMSVRARIVHALAQPAQGRIAGLLAALESADDELAPVITSVLGRIDADDRVGAVFEALRMPNVAARKAAAAMLAARGTRDALDAVARRASEDPSDEVRRVCSLLLSQ
jgi:HEAT repeat protein